MDSRFKDAIEHVRETVDPDRIADEFGTQYTFFGENMVKHSLGYQWDDIPRFIGFDIYSHEKDEYLPVEKSYSMFESLGLQTAPIVDEVHVDEFGKDYEIPESQWRDGKAEGVVIINTDQEEDNRSGFSTRAKMVTEEFVEKHKETVGGGGREAVHDYEKIASKFATEARIRKQIHKMQDEGRDLGMELMENKDGSTGLPMRVVEDIFIEECPEIVRSNHTINMKKLRSKVAKKCVSILRRVMKNSELNGESTVREGAES